MAIRLSDRREIERALRWLTRHLGRSIEPEWLEASTVVEALCLLEQYGPGARLFAGGIDLVGLMKAGVAHPAALVSIKPVGALNHIVLGPRHVEIGAGMRIRELERSPLVGDQSPLLLQALQVVASPHIRNMSSIAGNLCQETRCWYYRRSPDTGISFDCRRKGTADVCHAIRGQNQYHAVTGAGDCVSACPSDLATVLLALDARVRTAHRGGGRLIPIDQLYTSLGTTLRAAELISAIQIPVVEPGAVQRFSKFRNRQAIDHAIVSVAAVLRSDRRGTVSEARIVLGGVSHTPVRAMAAEKLLVGERLTPGSAGKAAELAVADLEPLSQNAYKIQVARELVKRVILD
jgi:xanthine dehydrogenase YagS FAD-binding subunit